MKQIINLITLFLLIGNQGLFGQYEFPQKQIVEDLQFYKTRLERNHPNLYLYNTRERIENFFDSLILSLNKPLSEAEFYRELTLTSSIIRDGHTLILPSRSFVEFHNLHSRFLPLQMGIFGEHLYVKMNCTSSIVIEDGTIVDSINGLSSQEIIKELLDRQVRDGNSLSYSEWILDTYFREYYSYAFGHPEVYDVSYTNENVKHSLKIPALLKDSIYHHRLVNYPGIYSSATQSKGVYLEYDSSYEVAIITIKDFHTEVLRSEYGQDFSRELPVAPYKTGIRFLKIRE